MAMDLDSPAWVMPNWSWTNHTAMAMNHNHPANLGHLFESVSSRYSANTAISQSEQDHISYNDLNTLVNIFSYHLIEIGIKKSDVIAIINTKETSDFAIMLACLKIGAIYCNIDPAIPFERLKKILTTAHPRILCCKTEEKHKYIFFTQTLGCAILHLDEIKNDVLSENKISRLSDRTHSVTSNDIAYLMFTSGSTGFPKGAIMSHGNLIEFLKWSIEENGISETDVLTNINPMYFDNSVFDFYTALFSGASLIPVKKALLSQPTKLVKYVSQMKCTVWFSVPSLLIYLNQMRAISVDKLTDLRIIMFGGEGYPKQELLKLYKIYKQQARFINVYGPTECTCICSSYEISENDFTDLSTLPPLGKLLSVFSAAVINENGDPVEPGINGELLLAGDQVGSGYYRDKARTKESFGIRNISDINYHSYRTGDIVHYDKSGLLHFCGRKDNQVKHMGYRIELEEIELALTELKSIQQAIVIYKRPDSRHGLIIAFIMSETDMDENKTRNKLSETLPAYMIPNRFIFMDELPKNANGKIDRKQLETWEENN